MMIKRGSIFFKVNIMLPSDKLALGLCTSVPRDVEDLRYSEYKYMDTSTPVTGQSRTHVSRLRLGVRFLASSRLDLYLQ